MATQRHEVVDLELDEISLVDVPANMEARVAIWKRGMTATQTQETFMQAIRKAFTGLGAPEEVMTKVDEALAEAQQVLAAADPPPKEPAVTEKKIDDEQVKKQADDLAVELKKRDDELVDLRKRLETNEAEMAEIRKREAIAVTAQRIAKAGVPTEQAIAVASNLQGLPEAQAKFFEEQVVSAAKQAAESELLGTLGSGRVAKAGSDGAEIEQRIAKRMEATGVTKEMAYADLYKGDMNFRRLVEADRAVVVEERA